MNISKVKYQYQGINLSGGNKRKLSLACALIGGTKIIFLDEPSSGVDTLSKKQLLNCLNQTIKMNNGCAILTTHSMSEAEAISTNVGILINGLFEYNGKLYLYRQFN